MLNSSLQTVYSQWQQLVKSGFFYTGRLFVRQCWVKTLDLYYVFSSFLRDLYTTLLFVITLLERSFYSQSTGLITKTTNYLIN